MELYVGCMGRSTRTFRIHWKADKCRIRAGKYRADPGDPGTSSLEGSWAPKGVRALQPERKQLDGKIFSGFIRARKAKLNQRLGLWVRVSPPIDPITGVDPAMTTIRIRISFHDEREKHYMSDDRDALEAAEFYVATFPDSEITSDTEAPTDYPSGKAGDVLTVNSRCLARLALG